MTHPFLTRHPSLPWFLAALALFTLAASIATEGTGLGLLSTSFSKTLGKTLCLVALVMDLIWGYAGLLSLGHMVFLAPGSFMVGSWPMFARTRKIVVQPLVSSPLPATPEEISQDLATWTFGAVGVSDLPWIWSWAVSFPVQMALAVLVPGVLAAVFGRLAFRTKVTGVFLSFLTQDLTRALPLYLFQNDSGLCGNYGRSGLQTLPGLGTVAQNKLSL